VKKVDCAVKKREAASKWRFLKRLAINNIGLKKVLLNHSGSDIISFSVSGDFKFAIS
jgi:hypothetical protein